MKEAPQICALGMHRKSMSQGEQSRAEQSISAMHKLIQWEVASNGTKMKRVLKQTGPEIQKPPLNLYS